MKPLENVLTSIGKRFDFHWKTQGVRLGCAAEACGFCWEEGFDWSGGELGMMCDVSQRALRLMNGRVLSA